jgi:hypothetical protein
MTSRFRNLLLFPVVFALSASICLAQTGAVTRIEQNSPSIAYSGNWYTNASSGNSGGSAALTNETGARAVVTFTGRSITWIGVGDRWNGLATVIVDGQPYKVDGWAATTRYQTVLFTVSGLSVGPHKLSIEINHERGPNGEGSWVWIDAFDVEDGAGVAGGFPAATVGHVENDNPALTYTGIWYSNTNAAHSSGTAVLAASADSAVSLNFNGSGISWIAYRDEWSGLARVFLDNELKATIDTYLMPGQARTAIYTVEGLSPGTHSLRVEVTGTGNQSSGGAWVWLDSFVVLETTAISAQTPVLSLNTTGYCIGTPWFLEVSNAPPNSAVRLSGTTNGASWTMPAWAVTDASGNLKKNGLYGEGTQGSYTLNVEVGGKTSNTLSVLVRADCITTIIASSRD